MRAISFVLLSLFVAKVFGVTFPSSSDSQSSPIHFTDCVAFNGVFGGSPAKWHTVITNRCGVPINVTFRSSSSSIDLSSVALGAALHRTTESGATPAFALVDVQVDDRNLVAVGATGQQRARQLPPSECLTFSSSSAQSDATRWIGTGCSTPVDALLWCIDATGSTFSHYTRFVLEAQLIPASCYKPLFVRSVPAEQSMQTTEDLLPCVGHFNVDQPTSALIVFNRCSHDISLRMLLSNGTVVKQQLPVSKPFFNVDENIEGNQVLDVSGGAARANVSKCVATSSAGIVGRSVEQIGNVCGVAVSVWIECMKGGPRRFSHFRLIDGVQPGQVVSLDDDCFPGALLPFAA